jgi:hypothetical protein
MAVITIMMMPLHAQTLSWEGLGRVKLGMTAEEAARALGTKLGPADGPFSKECYVTWRADGKDEALYYVVVDGRIAVIGLYLHDGSQTPPHIVDANGISVGSTEADIGRAYGQTEKDICAIRERGNQGRHRGADQARCHGAAAASLLGHRQESGRDKGDHIPHPGSQGDWLEDGVMPHVLSGEDCL